MSGILASSLKDKKSLANKSLLHDRLLPDWIEESANGESRSAERGNGNKSDMKAAFLDCFVAGLKGDPSSFGNEAIHAAALTRRARMITAIGGRTMTARTEWNFVTGTGLDNPTEVGLQWHPVYSVPYWPGSSIKGMMRAYALAMAPDADARSIVDLFGEGDVTIGQIFDWLSAGAEGKQPKKSSDRGGTAGKLIVFDALPEEGVRVIKDIMTPHYGDWYQTDLTAPTIDKAQAPGDWLNPVPVPFLVVPPQTTFHFGLALRDGDATLLDTAHRWLQEALEWIGGGAKTAAGYGRFQDMTPRAPDVA